MGNTFCWVTCIFRTIGKCTQCKWGSGEALALDGFRNLIDMSYFKAMNGSELLQRLSASGGGNVTIEISNDAIKM